MADVNSDQQQSGLESDLVIDRDRLAARHHAGADRQHALRRVRAAPSLGHLQRDQSVSRRHGNRSALHAISGVAARHLCGDVRRRRLGHATSNAPGRHRDRRPMPRRRTAASASATAAASANNNSARNAAINALANTGKGATSSGAAVSTARGDHGAARRAEPLQCRQCAALRQSPGLVRRLHHFVQSAARRGARRRRDRNRQRHQANPHAGIDPRQSRRHRAGVRPIARQRAGADRRRDRRRLYPARRALRELHPPDHDSFDAAVGRRRRHFGADAVPYRIRHHRH